MAGLTRQRPIKLLHNVLFFSENSSLPFLMCDIYENGKGEGKQKISSKKKLKAKHY
jgi:hypothetical protein